MEMKYNRTFDENGNGFKEYLMYLNRIKDSMPIELYNFISDENRHDFSDKSLHDSRIESIEFKNYYEGKNPNMIITLLGEMCEFKIYFNSISQYKILQNCRPMDLINYEIGLAKCFYETGEINYNIEYDANDEDIDIVFRAEFCDGEIEIFCKEIRIEEKME
jgi:hypothetical protein